MSNPNSQIYGTANFYNLSQNGGKVSNATFNDSAVNSGTITLSATFTDTSVNSGVVQKSAIFNSSATNSGTVKEFAVFTDSASNSSSGVILGNANFSSGTVNSGEIRGTNLGSGGVVDHPYHHGSYWTDAATLNLGDTVYLYRKENVKVPGATFEESGLSVTVNGQGIITALAGINHSHQHGSYWSDDSTLSVNSALYIGQYSNTLAGSGNFTEGSNTVTFVNGIVTTIQSNTASWYDDASDAAHAVTLNGSVTQSDEGGGVVAALFDGADGTYLNSSTINFGTSPFTIEGFFNPSTYSSSSLMGLFGGSNGGGNQPKLCSYINANNGNLVTDILDGIAGGIEIGTPLANFSTNSWNHVALVRDNGAFNLYVNGVLQAFAADDGRDLSSVSSPFGIGYFYECSTFNGKIAAFRVVVGTALYTSNFSVPTTLPTAVSGTQLLLNFGATAVPTV